MAGGSLISIRKKFKVLYLLNVSDIIFTYILLETGMFREANFFLNEFIHNTFFTLVVKIVLVLILVIFICRRLAYATEKQLRICNILVFCVLTFYTIINISHVFWLSVIYL